MKFNFNLLQPYDGSSNAQRLLQQNLVCPVGRSPLHDLTFSLIDARLLQRTIMGHLYNLEQLSAAELAPRHQATIETFALQDCRGTPPGWLLRSHQDGGFQTTLGIHAEILLQVLKQLPQAHAKREALIQLDLACRLIANFAEMKVDTLPFFNRRASYESIEMNAFNAPDLHLIGREDNFAKLYRRHILAIDELGGMLFAGVPTPQQLASIIRASATLPTRIKRTIAEQYERGAVERCYNDLLQILETGLLRQDNEGATVVHAILEHSPFNLDQEIAAGRIPLLWQKAGSAPASPK